MRHFYLTVVGQARQRPTSSPAFIGWPLVRPSSAMVVKLREVVKEAAFMKKQNRRRRNDMSRAVTLPELDQSKTSVLNTLGSLQSRRSYQHAMEEFIAWYCGEPRLA